MSTEKEILDFLSQDNNLPLALEIADYVETLRRKTHHEFWVALNHELAQKISASPLAENWAYENFNIDRLRRDWISAKFHMVVGNPSAPLLNFLIGQASPEKNYQVFCGINSIKFEHPHMAQLKGIAIAQNLTLSDKWLMVWNYLPQIPYTVDFIQKMHNDNSRDDYIRAAAQMIWDKFMAFVPEMEIINGALLQSQP